MTPVMKITSTVVSFMLLFGPSGFAGNLPSGGTVVHGNVGIGVDGHTMTLTQASQQAIMTWNSFSIGAGYGVNIDQPSAQAAMLARVVGGDPSAILGSLTADGIFYLVNPNGVFFGQNATVDVGQLIATTLNLTDRDFLAGKLNFGGDSSAVVENRGSLNADFVALLGRNVTNAGTIAAREAALVAASNIELGRIAGGKLSVDMTGLLGDAIHSGAIDTGANGDVFIAGDQVGFDTGSTVNAGADGRVVVQSEGKTVMMPGAAITAPGGEVRINAPDANGEMGEGTRILAGATINTRGGTDDGFIEVSGHSIEVEGANLQAGEVLFDPDYIVFLNLEGTGPTGGGTGQQEGPITDFSDLREALTEDMGTTSYFDIDGANNYVWVAVPDLLNPLFPGYYANTEVPVLLSAGDADTIRFEAVLDITVVDDFNVATATGNGSVNLVFDAGRDIIVSAPLTLDGTGAFTATAGNDIRLEALLTTVLGGVYLTGSGNTTYINDITTGGGDVIIEDNVVLMDALTTISTSGGDVEIIGRVDANTTQGFQVLAGGGNVILGDSVGMTTPVALFEIVSSGTTELNNSIVATSTIDLDQADSIVLGSEVSMDAGGAIRIGGVGDTVTGEHGLSAVAHGGGIDVQASLGTPDGKVQDVSLEARGGNLVIGPSASVYSSGSVYLNADDTAGTADAIINGSVWANDTVRIVAADVRVNGGVTSRTLASLLAYNGDLTIDAGAAGAATVVAPEVIAEASDNIFVGDYAIDASDGAAHLTADTGNIAWANAVTTLPEIIAGSIYLNAPQGAINGNEVQTTGSEIVAVANDYISLTNITSANTE
jgi:filamentous hemagglutinin family protein